jgi:UDP-N-acetylglucosamine transferase subunit ALG13
LIFVSVGGQLPFDRLIEAVDGWAAARGRCDLFAQIGAGSYTPRCFEFSRFLSAPDFERRAHGASGVVAHAGIGVILSARALRKPLLLLPRRAALGEHRNDHQLHTAERFRGRAGIAVAGDAAELWRELDALEALPIADSADSREAEALVHGIRSYLGARRADGG